TPASGSLNRRQFESQDDRKTPAKPDRRASVGVARTATNGERRPAQAVSAAFTPTVEPPLEATSSARETRVADAAFNAPVEARVRAPPLSPLPPAPVTPRAPWTIAADAGIAIGRGSQSAGIATAGFFTRLGKKVAGSF